MLKSLELKQQAEALLQQAELARKEESAVAIAEIKGKMQSFGLTLQDLRTAGVDPGRPPSRIGEVQSASKYRGPNGELWAGGRGRKPDWALKAISEKGEAGLEAYRIK